MTSFDEGERVLCYEPDPNKVRVVYDAKILQIADDEELDDGLSKKYLVHFQGWSSSWDRFVSKDFLLKDTDVNRDLQRDLFEKAEESKSARKKKKKRQNASDGSLSEDPSLVLSPSSLRTLDEAQSAGEDKAAKSTVDAEGGDGFVQERDDLTTADSNDEIVVPFKLSETLKRHLEQDFAQVVKRRKLNPVPAETNIVSVLESFARHYATSKLLSHERHFGKSPFNSHRKEKSRENFEHILDCINICKEVMEGLRIITDFYLEGQLLYENEKPQFKKVMSKPLPLHLQNPTPVSEEDDLVWSATNKNAGKANRSRGGSEEPAAAKSSSHGSSGSGRSTPTLPGTADKAVATSSIERMSAGEVASAVIKWRLLAKSCPSTIPQEPLPSLLYGPIYLLRLFVKIPEVLGKMKMPQRNSRLLAKYFENLLSYLETNSDFFTHLYQ